MIISEIYVSEMDKERIKDMRSFDRTNEIAFLREIAQY